MNFTDMLDKSVDEHNAKTPNAQNVEHWQKEYYAPNVESWIFRTYGRIFKNKLKPGAKVLDFGCGEGATAGFYKALGFDVYGVDVCELSIKKCKEKFPDIEDQFRVMTNKLELDTLFNGVFFDLIVCNQVLYYMDNKSREYTIKTLYNITKVGGFIQATHMSFLCTQYYDHAKYLNNGLWMVNMSNERYTLDYYYVNFATNKTEVEQIMKPFERLEIGQYSEEYIESEGLGHHYNYVGVKR